MLISDIQQSDLVMHICMHSFKLSQDIEYSSLCYTVKPFCSSILYIVVCILLFSGAIVSDSATLWTAAWAASAKLPLHPPHHCPTLLATTSLFSISGSLGEILLYMNDLAPGLPTPYPISCPSVWSTGRFRTEEGPAWEFASRFCLKVCVLGCAELLGCV